MQRSRWVMEILAPPILGTLRRPKIGRNGPFPSMAEVKSPSYDEIMRLLPDTIHQLSTLVLIGLSPDPNSSAPC